MPLNEDQLTQIRDERKEQIMAAGLRVFAKRGLAHTKMSMIAAEAGISHGLLYHYFKSKDELFLQLLQSAMEESIAGVQELYRLPGSPLDKLRSLTELILLPENAAHFMLIHHARTAEDMPDKARQILQDYSMKTYIDQLLPLFEEGQKMGELVEDEPRRLITTYLTVLTALMVLNTHEHEDFRQMEPAVLLRMIAKPGAL
ncbi:helix-turn-helix domain-containing protein [Paenibacillus aurantius]|uniref:Helix-turn-helix domain-containing protein n=1 Tax=Paenibacillus aurantius TaxID=2918900 RepID=A0AA96LDS9_9BACL|nr:helix-turn-helix domain-containing protein [Paenibacillus aurantius]WNQ11178.1 helix-turn-helix domain-containing protein [Paenibacillus aurantius]